MSGWFETADVRDVSYSIQYGALTKEEGYHMGVIRLALSSVAQLAIIPMQDYLGLGSEARMNTPSTVEESNWCWRLEQNYGTSELAQLIYRMSSLYGRVHRSNRNFIGQREWKGTN